MQTHGAPKHIISDQASVFVGDAFSELLRQWNIKPRLGAVGKHGSIAVTERVIKTLNYEWLKHVPLIKGFDHLTLLCTQFESWYNAWRPHMTLEGLRPDDFYYGRKPEKPRRDAKNRAIQYRTSRLRGNTAHSLSPQERCVVPPARLSSVERSHPSNHRSPLAGDSLSFALPST